MQRETDERDEKNFLPKKFLQAKKYAIGSPTNKATNVDKKACFIQKDIHLQDDDVIIMLSDGVVAADESVQSAILLTKNSKSESIARELVDIAYKNTPKDLDHDMTVMVARVSKIQT